MVVCKKLGCIIYANIVLECGYIATDDFWQWRKNIEDGKIDRRAGSVIILDQDGTSEVARYNFYEAWPCKWNVPELDSDSSAMAIEKIELAVEKVERV
jgi:phage tail-like protein